MSRPLARRRRFWRTMSHTRKPGNASRSGREGREVELWPRSLLTACERIYTRGHTTRCARLPRSAHKGARRTALATPSASVPPASESWQGGVQPAGGGTRRAPRGVLGLDKRVLPPCRHSRSDVIDISRAARALVPATFRWHAPSATGDSGGERGERACGMCHHEARGEVACLTSILAQIGRAHV